MTTNPSDSFLYGSPQDGDRVVGRFLLTILSSEAFYKLFTSSWKEIQLRTACVRELQRILHELACLMTTLIGVENGTCREVLLTFISTTHNCSCSYRVDGATGPMLLRCQT